MAIMIPANPSDFNKSLGEQQVFNALKGLDDRCYVFYSVNWINSLDRTIRKAEGEADFVVFDPQSGVLVIEVKSGDIKCEKGQLYQVRRDTGETFEIDPEAQARVSKHILRRHVESHLGSHEKCMVCHTVWFPSVNFPKKKFHLSYPPETVLDATSLLKTSEAIGDIFNFWASKFQGHSLTKTGIEKVIQAIAPTFSIAISLRTRFDLREQKLIQMTSEQTRILDFLEEQKKALITGPAGTGKTVLALEKARRLSEQKSKILFVCYNSALRKFLDYHHSIPGVEFHTIHSLTRKCCPNVSYSGNEFPKHLIEYLAEDDNGWDFNDVLIDEGQDFDNDLIEWLNLRTKGAFYIFCDHNQLIRRDEIPAWIKTAECRLVLSKNCRNTLQIARTSYRCASLRPIVLKEGVLGEKPVLYDCATDIEAWTITEEIIKRLLKNSKYSPEEVAILSMETLERSCISESSLLKHADITQDFEKGKVTFTTVRKFKGLEAKAVILVDVRLRQFSDSEWKRRFYIGCSRAVHELHIVCEGVDNYALEVAISNLRGEDNYKISKSILSTLLNAKWQK